MKRTLLIYTRARIPHLFIYLFLFFMKPNPNIFKNPIILIVHFFKIKILILWINNLYTNFNLKYNKFNKQAWFDSSLLDELNNTANLWLYMYVQILAKVVQWMYTSTSNFISQLICIEVIDTSPTKITTWHAINHKNKMFLFSLIIPKLTDLPWHYKKIIKSQ